MRKLKLIFHSSILIVVIMLFIYLNYSSFREYEQCHFGGIVINNTNHNIAISDAEEKKIVPPWKSSRDINMFDADYIFIERPTFFEGRIYPSGKVKFCDFSTINITSKGNVDKINPSRFSFICKVLNDFRWIK